MPSINIRTHITTCYLRHANMMANTTESMTLGWKFTYALTDEIDCNDNIRDMQGVEFVTNVNEKQQKMVTGFKIMIQLSNQTDAELRANQAAFRLTWLLVASSGTYSAHRMERREEMILSTKRRVSQTVGSGYRIRNNAMVNIDPRLFDDILNLNTEIAEKMQFIANACMASRARDYASVIKYLVLACNEEPAGDLAKFKSLRNALSHNKEPLNNSTVKGLNDFGRDYFTLTDDGKFDAMSASNLHHLEVQAGKFLTHMHNRLREELSQAYDDLSDDD